MQFTFYPRNKSDTIGFLSKAPFKTILVTFYAACFIFGTLIIINPKVWDSSITKVDSVFTKTNSPFLREEISIAQTEFSFEHSEINTLINTCVPIDTAILDRNSLTTIVDNNFLLTPEFEPQNIVTLTPTNIPADYNIYLNKDAAHSLLSMIEVMNTQGINVKLTSGWRTYDDQKDAYNLWVGKVGAEEASNYAAQPGASEHQLGTAIDILGSENNYRTESEASVSAWDWLESNAHKYGYIQSYPKGKQDITGFNYEPWHYRYVGLHHAESVKEQNITLKEYLYKLNRVCL